MSIVIFIAIATILSLVAIVDEKRPGRYSGPIATIVGWGYLIVIILSCIHGWQCIIAVLATVVATPMITEAVVVVASMRKKTIKARR